MPSAFRSLLALVTMTLPPAALAAPPATVAVAFDARASRVVVAEGLADRATRRAVTAEDPVRIASISKLVTALGVMRLVDQGRLDLDRDVSAYLGWPLRNPAFPATPITLRLLLSHQASLVDGGELYIVPLDETLRQRLEDARVWDPVHAPGSGWFHYANLNFPVVASVMEAATGERFDRLMAREVLRPLKLDACYNWSGCAPRSIKRAVVLYRAGGEVAKDDLAGAAPPCLVVPAADGSCDLSTYRPGDNGALFSPQGGLRISMRDLARIGRLLLDGGRGFLSPEAFAELTRPAWGFDGANGVGEEGESDGVFRSYGLAIHRIGGSPRDDLFGDGRARLGHSGEAYGLRSGLWIDPAGRSAWSAREEAVVARALGKTTP
jgi:CubicO group peptidase (beta-lactamase class C family)